MTDRTRTPRRQQLVKHLIKCGERPVLEALLAVAAGGELDAVLESYARLHPDVFEALGADVLPIDAVVVIEGVSVSC